MSFLSWASSVLDSVDTQATEKVADIKQQIEQGTPAIKLLNDAASSIAAGVASVGVTNPTVQINTNEPNINDSTAPAITNSIHESPARTTRTINHATLTPSSSAASLSTLPATLPKHTKEPSGKSINRDEEYLSLLASNAALPPTTVASPSPARLSSPALTRHRSNSRSSSPAQTKIPPASETTTANTATNTTTTIPSNAIPVIAQRSSPSTSPAQLTRKLSRTDVPAGPTPSPPSTTVSASVTTPLIAAPVATAIPTTSSTVSSNQSVNSLMNENSLLKSEIVELTNEITGLKQVWNDSRQQCTKLKTLLESAKDMYQVKLKEAESDMKSTISKMEDSLKATLDAKEKEHLKQLDEIKKAQQGSNLELTNHLTQLSKLKLEHTRELTVKDETLLDLNSALEAERVKIADREEAIRRLEEKLEQQQLTHMNQLALIHEEALQRERSLEESQQLHSQRLDSFDQKGRELEQNNEEYINLLASLQRQLESAHKQIDTLQSSQRMAELKIQNENETKEQVRSKMESLEKNHAAFVASLKAKMTNLQVKAEELQQQLDESRANEEQLTQKVKEFESSSTTATPSDQSQSSTEDLESRLKESEARLQGIAEHLLSKSQSLERATAEKTSLRLQLENETTRVTNLEIQLRAWKEKYTELEQGRMSTSSPDDYDLENGSSSSTSSSTSRRGRHSSHSSSYGVEGANITGLQAGNAVAKAVGFMDSMGQQVSMLLRRYPGARVGFGLYVIVIHLWFAFVFYHLMHEFGQEHHTTSASGIPKIPGMANSHS